MLLGIDIFYVRSFMISGDYTITLLTTHKTFLFNLFNLLHHVIINDSLHDFISIDDDEINTDHHVENTANFILKLHSRV